MGLEKKRQKHETTVAPDREEGDEEDGTRIANRPGRNFFRTSRDGGGEGCMNL